MPFSPEYKVKSKIVDPKTGFTEFVHSEEEREEIVKLQPRTVLVVCLAGQNRSRLIKEVLDGKNYVAYHGGVDGAHPLTEDELIGHQAIIFALDEDKKRFFEKYPELETLPWRIFGIGDSQVVRSLGRGGKEVLELKKKISERLDKLGFVDLLLVSWKKID